MPHVLACLYDIHGNLPALEAVIADARAQGAEQWLLGGDYAIFGAWPEESVAALRALDGPALWIRGNGERWSAHPDELPAEGGEPAYSGAHACASALGDRLTLVLDALPPEGRLEENDTRVCHGSPLSDVRSFFPEPAEDEAELLDGVTEPRMIFGHTHVPFRRVAATGTELINPGSVGVPLDGDHRAAYALVADDGAIVHRRVAYDHTQSIQALRQRYGDEEWVQIIAGRLERASL